MARDRRVSDNDIERLIAFSGTDLAKAQARAVHAFRIAIEAAMRAGEITGLTRDAVDIERRIAHLPNTKTGQRAMCRCHQLRLRSLMSYQRKRKN